MSIFGIFCVDANDAKIEEFDSIQAKEHDFRRPSSSEEFILVFIIGWGLAYGPGGNLFCGASQFFCWQLEYDQYPTWLFQVTNDVGGEHDSVYDRL